MTWMWFRTFDVVAREGSLTAAASVLGVSQSTVSRHVAQLEEMAGSPLFVRMTPIELTARGLVLLAAIEPMVDAALMAQSALEELPEPFGEVTVSTVGELIRWALIDALPAFWASYPNVQLRLLASNQVSRLASGEADIALRMFRPQTGDLVARQLTTTTYGLFGAESLALNAQTPWLGLTGSLASISDQLHAERLFGGRPARLLVEDMESLGLAVEAGLGVAILPGRLITRLRDVVEIAPEDVGAPSLGPITPRHVWLVVHASKQHVPKVRAVMDWLVETFERSQ